MASINQVSIELQVKGEREATQALKRYSDASDKLTRSVLNAAGKVESTARAWDRANKLYQKGVLNSKGLQAAQTQLGRELAVVNGYLKSNGALNTQKAIAELKAAQATKEAAQKAEEAARAEQKLKAERERLATQFNPLYAASKRYETQLNELNRAKKLGVVNSQQYDAALEQLNTQLAMGATSTSQMNQASHIASRQTNAYGMAMQQVGYQIGDFIVQVQSGTNAFVAFGQQATQMVGILPMLAGQFGMNVTRLIAISSVLGVVIPLATALGAAFMRTRNEAKDAASGIQTFEDRLGSARSEISRTSLEIERMNRGFETLSELALDEAVRKAEQEVEAAQRALRGATLRGDRGPGITTEQAQENLEAAKERLRLSEEELETFRRQVQERERLKNIQELSNQELQVGKGLSNNFLEKAEEIRKAYENISDEIGDAATQALVLAGIDIASGINEATKAAAELAAQMGISVEKAAELQLLNRQNEQYAGRGTTSGREPFLQGENGPVLVSDIIGRDSDTGGAGGAGGAASEAEDYLAKLQREAELKRHMIGLSEQEQRRLEIINQLKEKGLPIEEERINAILRTESALRRAQQEEKRREDIMNTVSSNIESALMGLVDGTKSVEDAFRSMLRNIILEIYKQQVASPFAKQAGGFLTNIVGSLFGGPSIGAQVTSTSANMMAMLNANGNAFNNGNVIPFANGGVVNSDTYFPMANGQTGLMGEAGPEAIMPLKRTKGGKLGVVAEGAGDVNQTLVFNISANGDDSVKRIVRNEAPRIAEQAKAAVVDAKQRGGSYGRAFR